jgi:hypothetical protein
VSRRRKRSELTVGDLLIMAAGAGFGLVLGYVTAERVGRVNAGRVAFELGRWRTRHRHAPAHWSDEDAERLEARVLDALRADAVLSRRAVRVRVFEGGIVELSGRVAEPGEVASAGELVRGMDGVTTLLNHLLVAPGSGVAAAGPSTPRAARG